jgi:hypothetical protein
MGDQLWEFMEVQTVEACSTMGTGGPFPGGKARQGRDADQSHPPSSKVVNE